MNSEFIKKLEYICDLLQKYDPHSIALEELKNLTESIRTLNIAIADLSLIPAHELTVELGKRFEIMVFIGKKLNVDNKIGTITWDRYQGDPNMVAGLAMEASVKAIYGKLSTAFPVQDF